MAENKKSFIAYVDWNHIFKKLSDDEAGKLAKMLFAYVSDENPTAPDRITELIFEPIKHNLKRDLVKYETIKNKREVSGRLGGINSGKTRSKRIKDEANEAFASNNPKNEANEAVNDNVNDNVIKEERILKNWEYEKNNFLKNEQWVYNFCSRKKIIKSELETLMIDFISNIELKEDFKNAAGLRNHFTNHFDKIKRDSLKTSFIPKNEIRHSAPPLKSA